MSTKSNSPSAEDDTNQLTSKLVTWTTNREVELNILVYMLWNVERMLESEAVESPRRRYRLKSDCASVDV